MNKWCAVWSGFLHSEEKCEPVAVPVQSQIGKKPHRTGPFQTLGTLRTWVVSLHSLSMRAKTCGKMRLR